MPQEQVPGQAGFFHNVFFRMRENGDPSDVSRLAEGCRTYLTGIPGIVRLNVGTPAGTQRDVVDNSYGVALLVEFVDAAACHVYDSHPDHLRFIAECSQFWSRVQVYDTLPLSS